MAVTRRGEEENHRPLRRALARRPLGARGGGRRTLYTTVVILISWLVYRARVEGGERRSSRARVCAARPHLVD